MAGALNDDMTYAWFRHDVAWMGPTYVTSSRPDQANVTRPAGYVSVSRMICRRRDRDAPLSCSMHWFTVRTVYQTSSSSSSIDRSCSVAFDLGAIAKTCHMARSRKKKERTPRRSRAALATAGEHIRLDIWVAPLASAQLHLPPHRAPPTFPCASPTSPPAGEEREDIAPAGE